MAAATLGVLSFPFIRTRAHPPTTATDYSASYSELNAFLIIVAVLGCIGIFAMVLLLVSICRRLRRRRQNRRRPLASGDVILDSTPWDEILIAVELAERDRWRVEKIPVTVYSRQGEGEGEGEICAICLEEMEGGEEVKVMPRCKHTFHDDCIDQWLGVVSASCPVCRNLIVAEKEAKKDHISIDVSY
ncbi:RING-H2 finger protein ATL64-like [Typha latifolia]|uniref:RING-H2 finger protein ATL64-like n=1 Tax=Typha latifolia TaxID=4733 RepID=UPI003C2F9F86